MKKIKNRHRLAGRSFWGLVVGCLLNTAPLRAQTDIWEYLGTFYSAGEISSSREGTSALTLQINETPVRVPYTGHYVDFIVPAGANQSWLALTVRGADGGGRTNTALISPFKINGGGGAFVEGYIPIGTGSNEIPPGATLRFIIGKKGDNVNRADAVGADGGAGTGLFFKKPGESTWHILAVAGGGGGAYSDCCLGHQEGRSAATGTSGVTGGGAESSDFSGGTNGNHGTSGAGASGGGGLYGDRSAIQNGVPIGATCELTGFTIKRGQFGCGCGGPSTVSGGGGGGYSGGGAGGYVGAGGGGGSYANPDWIQDSRIYQAVKTFDPKDGYISLNFLRTIQIKYAADQSKCLDDYGAGTDNGNNIQLYQCHDRPAQQWIISNSGIHLGKDLKKCIDLSGGNTTNGANIQLWDCQEGNFNQVWIYDVNYQAIRSGIDFNKCLDLTRSNTADETNIQLWDCNRTDAQKWRIDGIPWAMPATSNNSIHLASSPNKCVDISQSGTANGTNIQLWDCNGTNAQHFTFNGHVIRMQSLPNKCLDVTRSSFATGTNIQLYDCNGTKAQQWIYDGFSKAFRSGVYPHMCMDVDQSQLANGTNIQLWDCNGTDAQQFVIGN